MTRVMSSRGSRAARASNWLPRETGLISWRPHSRLQPLPHELFSPCTRLRVIFCYACLVLLCVPHIGQLSPRAPIPRRLALAAAIYLFDMSHLMERPGLSLLSPRCPHALLLIIRVHSSVCNRTVVVGERAVDFFSTVITVTLRLRQPPFDGRRARSSWAPTAAPPWHSGPFYPPPPRARLRALASAPSRRRRPPALSSPV